jgi:hypothetical protein
LRSNDRDVAGAAAADGIRPRRFFNMNEFDRLQFADLLDGMDTVAATLTVFLRFAERGLAVIDPNDATEVGRFMASCNVRAMIDHALRQQQLLDQLRGKAESMLEPTMED